MFHKDISVGPKYICTCCEQLWYKSSVTKSEAAESGGGGALGASAPPLFVPGEKVPLFGNESALFS